MPREYCPIKGGVVCENEGIRPFKLTQPKFDLRFCTCAPLGICFIDLHSHPNDFKFIMPYVFFSGHLGKAEHLVVVRLKVNGNYQNNSPCVPSVSLFKTIAVNFSR